MKYRFLALFSLVAAIFLLVMMNLTTPQNVGPFGVLVFFASFYVVCLGVATGLLKLGFWIRGKKSRKMYYYGSVLAFAPVIIVALGSFGGVGVLEIVLVGLLMVVGCFIVSKRL